MTLLTFGLLPKTDIQQDLRVGSTFLTGSVSDPKMDPNCNKVSFRINNHYHRQVTARVMVKPSSGRVQTFDYTLPPRSRENVELFAGRLGTGSKMRVQFIDAEDGCVLQEVKKSFPNSAHVVPSICELR